MEVRELLSEYDFPGDDLPLIQGSALKALEGEEQWEAKIVDFVMLIKAIGKRSIDFSAFKIIF